MIGLKAYEKAETFIDRYSSSFEEYLSSVVNKLRDTDSEYKDIEERIAIDIIPRKNRFVCC